MLPSKPVGLFPLTLIAPINLPDAMTPEYLQAFVHSLDATGAAQLKAATIQAVRRLGCPLDGTPLPRPEGEIRVTGNIVHLIRFLRDVRSPEIFPDPEKPQPRVGEAKVDPAKLQHYRQHLNAMRQSRENASIGVQRVKDIAATLAVEAGDVNPQAAEEPVAPEAPKVEAAAEKPKVTEAPKAPVAEEPKVEVAEAPKAPPKKPAAKKAPAPAPVPPVVEEPKVEAPKPPAAE